MTLPSDCVTCDGCGVPASPAHVAERLARLELATRYRPVHINTLFIATAPLPGPANDFYGPPMSREFFNSFLEGVGIPGSDDAVARLLEFQRAGYYLSYLSECPTAEEDTISNVISRLAATLLRRIRLNYKPKHIVILAAGLIPLVGFFEAAGLAAVLQPTMDRDPGR